VLLTSAAKSLGTGESPLRKTIVQTAFGSAVRTLILAALATAVSLEAKCSEQAQGLTTPNNDSSSFPDLNEVFQERVFKNRFDRDVFFLRRIHADYSVHWPELLTADLNVKDYIQAPDKMLRFIEELGTAMEATDDLVACTNLAPITSYPEFYANTNAYRPEILRAAGSALIRIEPKGGQLLAGAFNERHYRTDSASLEVLAEAVAKSGVADSGLREALAAVAFSLMATNGGSYPRCTKEAVCSLLYLPEGVSVVGSHLTGKEIFKDPGRFHAVLEAIADARPAGLMTNLTQIAAEVAAKQEALAKYPGPYLEDLCALQARIKLAIEQIQNMDRNAKP
jgi:hypothetical protein